MRTYFRLLLIITSVSVLASCSSFVKQQLLYPDSNTVQISGITHSQLLAMHNLEKSMLGEPSRLSYYLGDVSSLSDDFIPPTLILSGGLDKVSNRSEIAAIAETDNISVVDIHNRGHIEMMIYDNKLNEIIVNWLGGNKSSGQNMPLDTLTTHKND